MFKLFSQLILGFVCGILVIKWIPVTMPLDFSEIFVKFIFNPLEFFAGSLVFIIGIILHGKIIRSIFMMTFEFINKKKFTLNHLILCCGIILNFVLLIREGVWQATLLLCFSILYGMISLDYQKVKYY